MSGWGPKTTLGPGDIGRNATAQLPLVPGNYDDFVLSYDINDNLTQVLCYRQTKLLLTLTLSYDINQNLIQVLES